MIVIYEYPDRKIRYTEVALIREQLDRKHVLRLKNGKWVTPKIGWVLHDIRLSRSEEMALAGPPPAQ